MPKGSKDGHRASRDKCHTGLWSQRFVFLDYVQAGRKLGRGSLFIYTLPSSPLAEAAIHFGLQGPVLYIGSIG